MHELQINITVESDFITVTVPGCLLDRMADPGTIPNAASLVVLPASSAILRTPSTVRSCQVRSRMLSDQGTSAVGIGIWLFPVTPCITH